MKLQNQKNQTKIQLKLIDTHCHLQFDDYKNDLEEVINTSIHDFNIYKLINIGIDLETSIQSINLSKKYPDLIYSAIGIHPNYTANIDDNELIKFDELIQTNKQLIKAYGEIGLDYYRNYSHPSIQQKYFIKQIKLAQKYNLPIIIHSRDSFDDTITILEDHVSRFYPVVFHCFSGNEEQLLKLKEKGYYIGIDGPITFKNNKMPNFIKKFPLNKILLETDSPFLTPHPFRGKRNIPGYVKFVAEKLSSIFEISLEKIAEITTQNAINFFKLGHTNTYTYELGNNLYINLTNRCTNKCYFCPAVHKNFNIGVYNLKLTKEPDFEEIITQIDTNKQYGEVVFCGFGEPTLKLDIVKKVAQYLKKFNYRIRLDTNGHGNVIHKRNILKELSNIIDTISISLNAENEEIYTKICNPVFGKQTYNQVLDFIKNAKKYIKNVRVSVVTVPEINIEKCKKIADNFNIEFKVRPYVKEGF